LGGYLRKALFHKATRGRQVSQSYSLPAPVGGWNARDGAANMSELDATILENWFPETTDIRVRKGYSDHVTGITGLVESLMVYNKPDGTQTMFAAAVDSFYNVTSAGAVGAAVVGSLTNGKWQHVNFTNSAGDSYLCCFNGTDSPRYWNGTAWLTITGVSTPAITGITTSTIINADVHKRRMWLVVNNSLKAYYLPVDSVGGAVKFIDLGGIAGKGGYIQSIGTWTIDAGEGADDYWVAYTSEGQIVVYRGTDPSSSSTWSLHGVWNIGEPIGRRCLMKYNGDLLIISVHEVIPLSRLVVSVSTNSVVGITEKIAQAMSKSGALYSGLYGWETMYYPEGDMVLVNIPTIDSTTSEQYAMNTVTGAWGKFTGLNAFCWAIYNKQPYFGIDGGVEKFWDDFSDNGSNITTDLKQAENYFNSRGQLKYFKSLRPIILSDGLPSIAVGMNLDFHDTPVSGNVSFSPQTYGIWDSGLWDTALWGTGLLLLNDWQTTGGVGSSGALRMTTVSANIEVRFSASDHLYEYGGVIG
jgi:hypothetical protein